MFVLLLVEDPVIYSVLLVVVLLTVLQLALLYVGHVVVPVQRIHVVVGVVILALGLTVLIYVLLVHV